MIANKNKITQGILCEVVDDICDRWKDEIRYMGYVTAKTKQKQQ